MGNNRSKSMGNNQSKLASENLNPTRKMTASRLTDSNSVNARSFNLSLEDQFQHLLNTKLNELYLENCIRRTVLQNRRYLTLALDLILKIEISVSPEEKKFIQLVSIYALIGTEEKLQYINQINVDLLPTDWQEDFLIWEKLCKNRSTSKLHVTDSHLKSWQSMLLACDNLDTSRPNYKKAMLHYEQALTFNPENVRAVANFYCLLVGQDGAASENLNRAEKLIMDTCTLFSNNAVITLYLQALLAKNIYMLDYIEFKTAATKEKISRLGFDVNEPFMDIKANFIYLVKGVDNKKNAWYYVWVKPSQKNAFLQALNDDIIHLEKYGTIVDSAYGEEPPTKITEALKKRYNIDCDVPIYPNALQSLLAQQYTSMAAERRTQIAHVGAPTVPHQTQINHLNSNNLLIEKTRIVFQELLGQGRYGKVYKGILDNKKTVAIKCYEGLNPPEKVAAEALHEIEVMRALQNTYLVCLLGYNNTPHSPMILMEYGPGGSLYNLIHSNESMSWSLKLRIAYDISRGLAYLHEKKYVHRDIKSLNIILFENNQAKLSDFGLSALKIHSSTNSVRTSSSSGAVAGSLLWMAPELFIRSTSAPNSKSDIWALGMVFFELASRALPFNDAQDESQVKEWIKEGTGERVPEECERSQPSFAKLMKSCWQERNQRPKASDIVDNPVFKGRQP